MKGTSNIQAKEFAVVYYNAAGQYTSIAFHATEAEAADAAARLVSSNKGGEAFMFKVQNITKLPTPEVVVSKIDVA